MLDSSGKHLARRNLDNLPFNDAVAPGADFSETSAKRAHFKRAHLSGATFEKAVCNGADFSEAILSMVTMEGAQLRHTKFEGAQVSGLRLKGAQSQPWPAIPNRRPHSRSCVRWFPGWLLCSALCSALADGVEAVVEGDVEEEDDETSSWEDEQADDDGYYTEVDTGSVIIAEDSPLITEESEMTLKTIATFKKRLEDLKENEDVVVLRESMRKCYHMTAEIIEKLSGTCKGNASIDQKLIATLLVIKTAKNQCDTLESKEAYLKFLDRMGDLDSIIRCAGAIRIADYSRRMRAIRNAVSAFKHSLLSKHTQGYAEALRIFVDTQISVNTVYSSGIQHPPRELVRDAHELQFMKSQIMSISQMHVSTQTWDDAFHMLDALYRLAKVVKGERAHAILRVIFDDRSMRQDLALAQLFLKIADPESPPSLVPEKVKQVVSHLRVMSFTYCKAIDNELARISKIQAWQRSMVELLQYILLSLMIFIGNVCSKYVEVESFLGPVLEGDTSLVRTDANAPHHFDCDASFNNWQAAWSDPKKQYCCAHFDRGCSPTATLTAAHVATTSALFDCDAAYQNREMAWSAGKKVWCCKHRSRGCPHEMQ